MLPPKEYEIFHNPNSNSAGLKETLHKPVKALSI